MKQVIIGISLGLLLVLSSTPLINASREYNEHSIDKRLENTTMVDDVASQFQDNTDFPWKKDHTTLKEKTKNIIRDQQQNDKEPKNLSQSMIIYVDDDNTLGPWDGSYNHPFQTIPQGIAHAQPGDTVYVFNGLYLGGITLQKPISLQGESLDCIIVGSSDISFGIYVLDTSQTEIKNFSIQNILGYGIVVSFSSSVFIDTCSITDTLYAVLIADESNTCFITNSTISYNEGGLWLLETPSCQIMDCSVYSNQYFGIYLDYSSNTYMRRNTLWDNGFNFGVDGNIYTCYQDIDTSNTVNDKPIYYLIGVTDTRFDETTSIGFLGIISGENITIDVITLEGIFLVDTATVFINHSSMQAAVFGLYCIKCSTISLQNLSTTECMIGVQLVHCVNISVHDVLCISSFSDDIMLNYCSSCVLTRCITNQKSIFVVNSDDISLYNCSTSELCLYASKTCILKNNTVSVFSFYGEQLDHYIHDIDMSNTVNNKPILYANQIHDYAVQNPSLYGFLGFISCTNITISSGDAQGIIFANTSKSTIQNTRSSHARFGVHLFGSSHNIIKDCFLSDNHGYGLYFTAGQDIGPCTDNIILNCIFAHNSRHGTYAECISNCSFLNCTYLNSTYAIYLYSSSHCTIDHCNISLCTSHGMYISKGSYCTIRDCTLFLNGYDGICLSDSQKCLIIRCVAHHNENFGFYLTGSSCQQNKIEFCESYENTQHGLYLLFSVTENTIRYNTFSNNGLSGCFAKYSSSNTLYRNNFIGHDQHASAYSGSNIWDNGYPCGGNYWDDYTGTDSDSDGIGSPFYPIPGTGDRDRYPLMHRFILGDMNVDGEVNFADINPFVLALTQPAQYQNTYHLLPSLHGDINQDGEMNFADINYFVQLLT